MMREQMEDAYQALTVSIIHTQISHLFSNDLESHYHVRKDNLANFLALMSSETIGIDQTHLL
jgi:hypothetical protein